MTQNEITLNAKRVQVTVRLTRKMVIDLMHLSKKNERSLNGEIAFALKEHIQNRQPREVAHVDPA